MTLMRMKRAMRWPSAGHHLLFQIMTVYSCAYFALVSAKFLGAQEEMQPKPKTVDVYYTPELLDKFSVFAVQNQAISDHRHTLENMRLQSAIAAAHNPHDKMLLEETAQANEESRLEGQNAYNEMLNFVNTLKQAMGATGGAPTCDDLTCGMHAVCETNIEKGPHCACEDGYEGDGFVCKPPVHFTPHSLIQRVTPAPQVKDLHVTVFEGVRVALVFQDISKGEMGYLMLGRATPAKMIWAEPVLFSNDTKAFSPKVAGLPNGRVAVAYRDGNKQAAGLLACGEIDKKTQMINWSPSLGFARNQAHEMAIVPLPHTRVAVMYSSHHTDSEGKVTSSFGSAMLVQLNEGGVPEVLGKREFAEIPVTRLTATLLSPSEFIVGYRGAAGGDAMTTGAKEEASAIYAQMKGTELVFDPHPLSLEPTRSQIWGRDIALISANKFSYSYESATEQKTKMAVVQVDPGTHKMTVVDGPITIGTGKTPYVKAISLPYAPREPRTFTFFQLPGEGIAKARMCAVSPAGKLSRCSDMNWAGMELSSVAGVSLGEGRQLFVFADLQGTPYYQFVGLFNDD